MSVSGQHIGYIRVSTVEQNTARQLDGVHLNKIFTDRVSGKSIDRPQLQACLEYAREGDILHVHSMDRLARNLDDLRSLVRQLTAKGVTVQFHKENLTFTGEDNLRNTYALIISDSQKIVAGAQATKPNLTAMAVA